MNNLKKRLTYSIFCIVISAILHGMPGLQVPGVDDAAGEYFRDSIAKAGGSYAICRLVNATVSVIMESSLELEPAGIGLSIAVGQAVDPVNDMVERLSDVIVLAIASLGVQEIIYEISRVLAPRVMALLFLVLGLLSFFTFGHMVRLRHVVIQLLVVIAVTRFCLPISSMANGYLQQHFFHQKIEAVNATLDFSAMDLAGLEDVSLPQTDGVLGTIENSAAYLRSKSQQYAEAVTVFVDNGDEIVENLLKLLLLYVAVFVIQVLLLPILMFWLLVRLVQLLLQFNRSCEVR